MTSESFGSAAGLALSLLLVGCEGTPAPTLSVQSNITQPSSGCFITTTTCPLFRQYTGTFPDSDPTANASSARCSARASEYYGWCGTTLPVTSNFYVGGIASPTTWPPPPLNPPALSAIKETHIFDLPAANPPIAGYTVSAAYLGHDSLGDHYAAHRLDGASGTDANAPFNWDKMELGLWSDPAHVDDDVQLTAGTQLTTMTGLDWGAAGPMTAYQAATRSGTGNTGVQLFNGQVGLSLDDAHCYGVPAFTKCPVTIDNRLTSDKFASPFQGADTDQLEFSFELKLQTVSSFSDAEGNVDVFLNLLDRNHLDDDFNYGVSYGAQAFHTDPNAPDGVPHVDPESNHPTSEVFLGNPSGYSPYSLKNSPYETDSRFNCVTNCPPFSNKKFKFSVDGSTLRNFLVAVNHSIVTNHFSHPLLSTNPRDYLLTEMVFNPELTKVHSTSTGRLGMTVKNLSVVSRQARDIIGLVEGVQPGTDGQMYVDGWACAFAVPQSIDVQLYVNNPSWAGGTFVSTTTANLTPVAARNPTTSEEIAYRCGDSTAVPHNFHIIVPSSNLDSPLFVHGISPVSVGLSNLLIEGSGRSASGLQISALYRFFQGSDRIFATDPKFPQDHMLLSYMCEGSFFSTANIPNPSVQLLWQCHRTSGGAHFLSVDPLCESQVVDFSVGYISNVNVPGMRPLYRFSYPSGGYSLATTDLAEGKSAGLVFDRILGYVW